jgi:hypothetical protein
MKIIAINKPIIAICGAKRSGKDVIADYLVQNHNYEKIKIAQPLKNILKELFTLSDDQLESDLKDVVDSNWNVTPRQIMQFFGTEIMQYKIQELLSTIGRKFWINLLLTKLKTNKKYVISDLRFIHEYEELIKHNAFIIKVIRPDTKQDTHCSEQEFKNIPCDLVLQNDKDIETLLIKFNDTLTSK